MSIQSVGAGVAITDEALAAQRHAKLADAAQKFEGMMMQELLKPMQEESGGLFGGADDPDRDGSLDNMRSYGTEAVANAIAKAGGLGVAKQVLGHLEKLDSKLRTSESEATVSKPVTAQPVLRIGSGTRRD